MIILKHGYFVKECGKHSCMTFISVWEEYVDVDCAISGLTIIEVFRNAKFVALACRGIPVGCES